MYRSLARSMTAIRAVSIRLPTGTLWKEKHLHDRPRMALETSQSLGQTDRSRSATRLRTGMRFCAQSVFLLRERLRRMQKALTANAYTTPYATYAVDGTPLFKYSNKMTNQAITDRDGKGTGITKSVKYKVNLDNIGPDQAGHQFSDDICKAVKTRCSS